MEKSRPTALQRLAEAISSRRHALGLTQRDVVEAGGPALSTLRQLEAAKSPGGLSRSTTFALDRALRWAPGSADAMLTDAAEPNALDTQGWPTSSGNWAEYVRRRTRQDDEAHTALGQAGEAHPDTPLAGYSDAQLIAELARRLYERPAPTPTTDD